MSKRYTCKQLQTDMDRVNRYLLSAGVVDRIFTYDHGGGYPFVYLAEPAQFAKTGGVLRKVESGTPKECFTAMTQQADTMMRGAKNA